jgi:hypothetical protein
MFVRFVEPFRQALFVDTKAHTYFDRVPFCSYLVHFERDVLETVLNLSPSSVSYDTEDGERFNTVQYIAGTYRYILYLFEWPVCQYQALRYNIGSVSLCRQVSLQNNERSLNINPP